LGIETDIQASVQRGTTTFGGLIINDSVFNNIEGNNPATVTDTSQLRWVGTTRGRLGFASDRWLIYGTGGVAYGGLKESGSIQPLNAFAPSTQIQNAPIVWDKSTTNVGWAAGVGVENAITQNLSWKLEYLYMDLGNTTANVSGGVGQTAGTPANCYAAPGASLCSLFKFPPTGTVTSHFTDNIVRVGLNYQFH
jgi:outer membrane immunogenic protein